MRTIRTIVLLIFIAAIVGCISCVENVSVQASESESEKDVVYEGIAGENGEIWKYDQNTKTITFSGDSITRCTGSFNGFPEHVVFDDSVHEINITWSTVGFDNVKSVYLGKNVSAYNAYLFFGRDKIEEYKVHENNDKYFSVNGDLYEKGTSGNALVRVSVNGKGDTYRLWEDCGFTYETAFAENTTIKTVVIPEKISTVNLCAFIGVDNIIVLNPACTFWNSNNKINIISFPNSRVYEQCEAGKAKFEPIDLQSICDGNYVEENKRYIVSREAKNGGNYFFIPKEDGVYRIYTDGETDTCLSVFDSSEFGVTDDDSGAGANAQIEESLKAGTLYMIRVTEKIDNAIDCELCVERISDGLGRITLSAQADKKLICEGQNLDITITATGLKENEQLFYDAKPGKLERAYKGTWIEIPVREGIYYPPVIYGIPGNGKLSIPIRDYYGILESGEYRYTHVVEGIPVYVDFVNFEDMYDENIVRPNGKKNINASIYGAQLYMKVEIDGRYKFRITDGGERDAWITIKKLNETGNVGRGKLQQGLYVRLEKDEVYTIYIEPEMVDHIDSSNNFTNITLVTSGPCEHVYGDLQTVKATCESKGYSQWECDKCGDVQIVAYTYPLRHRYILKIKEPTETAWGYTIHTCVNCKDEYYTDYVCPVKATTVVQNSTLKRPVFKSVKRAGKGKVKIVINKISGVKKYRIEYSKDKSFTKKVKSITTSKNTAVTKKLSKGKVYYFRVKSIAGNKTSKWSKIKKLKL